MISLVIVSFVAGVLTVAAPCILPLLPVIVGGTITAGQPKSLKRPLIIAGSLAASIVVFSLALKATTALLFIPTEVWSVLTGSIVALFGVNVLWPKIWGKVMVATGLQTASNRLLAHQKGGSLPKDILLGAALGPVFNSCSPTYALIIAAILPVSFAAGIVYLIAYALGVAAILLLVSLFGQSLVARLSWLSNERGVFKRIVGALCLITGIAIMFGIDKQVQAYVLQSGWYEPISNIERQFFER